MSDRGKLPKWAREEMERLERERDLAAAFVRTPEVKTDVAVPKDGTVSGFTFNAHAMDVRHSISSARAHGDTWLSYGPCETTTTQQPIRQYSTKLRAARALRCAVERECAERLRRVDALIREFESEESSVSVKAGE